VETGGEMSEISEFGNGEELKRIRREERRG
jgi:hypothetical protein